MHGINNRHMPDTVKFLNFSDTRKLCCNLHNIKKKTHTFKVFRKKDVNGIANSEDPDQTEQSDLGLHCLPRPICPRT